MLIPPADWPAEEASSIVRLVVEPALGVMAADVEVTQAVNRVKGAHARLPWDRVGRNGVATAAR